METTGRQHFRRVLVGSTATLAVIVAATAASYGVVGLSTATDAALRDRAVPRAVAAQSSPRTTVEAAVPVTAPAARLPEPPAAPGPVLERGDHGHRVRELQARLSQLLWFTPPMTGDYDRATRRGVSGFQGKRGLERTGTVDARTWRRLERMTRQPSEDVLFNRGGRPLFGPGDSGIKVRRIQARLRQIGWYFGDVTGSYGPSTRTAVLGFQGKRGIPQTGIVDRRTLVLLLGMTTDPTADELANRPPDPADGRPLDPRCRTGLALCIDKNSRSLRWVVDGKVRLTVDVRFGSAELPTREGVFSVYLKSRDHVSSLYHTSMPFAMFFSGGQAVHYSSDFAARGYAGASHGCVNVRDYDAVSWLYDQVQVGDKVVVYWS